MGRNNHNFVVHPSEILSMPGLRVTAFAGGTHLRINGALDVWPKKGSCIPCHRPVGTPTTMYSDIEHLRELLESAMRNEWNIDPRRRRQQGAELLYENCSRPVVQEQPKPAQKPKNRASTQAAKWFAKLPAGDLVAKRPVERIATWDDFARRFDSRPGEQAKLFNPGPAKPKAVHPARDPLAAHNSRKIEEWGPKFEPDPNFEKPPWERGKKKVKANDKQ